MTGNSYEALSKRWKMDADYNRIHMPGLYWYDAGVE